MAKSPPKTTFCGRHLGLFLFVLLVVAINVIIVSALSEEETQALYGTLVTALEERKSLGTIVQLVSMHPEVLQCKDSDGRTPLFRACMCEPPLAFEVIQYLVLTFPKAVTMMNIRNNTPLHTACRDEMSLETFQLLVKYFPPTSPLQNIYGWTPLHFSCDYKSSPEVIQYLAEQQPVASLMFNDQDKLPLDYAIKQSFESKSIGCLTRTMSEAALALAHVCFNASHHANVDLPLQVHAHVAVALSDVLSVDTLEGEYLTKLAHSHLDQRMVRSMVNNTHVQNFLRDVKSQSLLDCLIKRNRAGQATTAGTDPNYGSDCYPKQQMVTEVAEPVAANVQWLFWYFVCENPALCQAPRLSWLAMSILVSAIAVVVVSCILLLSRDMVLCDSVQRWIKAKPQQSEGRHWTLLTTASCVKSSPEVIQYLADQLPVASLILSSQNKLPLDHAEENGLATTATASLIRTMSKAAHALADVCTDASLRSKIDVPLPVSAHVAVTLSAFLSVNKSNPTLLTKDKQIVRAMVINAHVQNFLKEYKSQRLLEGLIKMKQAGRNKSLNSDEDSNNKVTAVEVLEAVSTNIDCLFLHLRECSALFKCILIQKELAVRVIYPSHLEHTTTAASSQPQT